MENSMVSIRNVSLSFDRHKILEKVNMDIKKGQFLGIIGPNGGGKTTLLKIILGLLKPDSGKVLIPKNTKIGYVPQFSMFDRDFPINVWDAVSSSRLNGSRPWSKISDDDRKKAEEVLRRLKIEGLRYKQIGELSGGEQQRVLIARALVIEPDILILDEPTASVDTVSGKMIYETLKELNDCGMTIILVSHDIGVVSKYVKTIACMNTWLFSHDSKKLTDDMLEKAYGCPVDLIAHGHPHRVLDSHEEIS